MKLGELIPIRERLETHSIPVPESGCWLWTGAVHPVYGYGRIHIGNKNPHAHRVSYETYKGSIPAGMLVCHKCDVRSCINPNHLFLGTIADNNHDMYQKKRDKNVKKTHCQAGHEFTEENVIRTGTGGRRCRACWLVYNRSYQKSWKRRNA